jgi:hypothetical protein
VGVVGEGTSSSGMWWVWSRELVMGWVWLVMTAVMPVNNDNGNGCGVGVVTPPLSLLQLC